MDFLGHRARFYTSHADETSMGVENIPRVFLEQVCPFFDSNKLVDVWQLRHLGDFELSPRGLSQIQ